MDDVLVVGEALVDIVVRQDGSVAEHPGGSPANVALGLGRLDRKVSLLTRIGKDERGTAIADHLQASHVRVLPSSVTAAATSTATARLNSDGVASYEFEIDWQLPDEAKRIETVDPSTEVPPAKALHTGSIAAFLAPGGDAVLDLVDSARGKMTITYDPNARPALMGDPRQAAERVRSIVAKCDLVKVSDEDLEWLAPGEDPSDVLDDWLSLGPAVVVLTRGPNGALAVARSGRADMPGHLIDVVDTVGAGDSFMSALLNYLAGADLLGADRLEALRAINARELTAMLDATVQLSAITCQRPGADPPWRHELS